MNTKDKSCNSCWWREGDRCYNEKNNFSRDSSGRSNLEAKSVCMHYKNKREMLSTVIPNDKLIILSELVD